MEVDSDSEQQPSGSGTVSKDKKRCLPLFLTNTNRSSFVLQQMCRNVVLSRFEVKKWNAVALWAWDIVVDNCAICRFSWKMFSNEY